MGSVTTWFYQGLAGIKRTCAGYKTFDIKPYIPKTMENLSVLVDTMYGVIEFSWKKQAQALACKVVVPFGTQAHFCLPTGYNSILVDG